MIAICSTSSSVRYLNATRITYVDNYGSAYLPTRIQTWPARQRFTFVNQTTTVYEHVRKE